MVYAVRADETRSKRLATHAFYGQMGLGGGAPILTNARDSG